MAIELPDMDKMWKLIEDIQNKSVQVSKLDLKIKYIEAITFREGKEKGMAVNMIENAYKQTGMNDELVPMRIELAERRAELDALRYKLELLREQINIWRTVSANERLGLQ